MAETIYTVSELTRDVRGLLEGHFGEVWVEGEISNHRHHTSGHHYFTLKDGGAQLSCVMFRGNARNLSVTLDNGQQIQARGDLTVYEARGQYQLIVKLIQPKGFGTLQAKFEALKQKLDAEGLFDPARKKPIPTSPRTIAIVTSPTGAAVQDFLNVVRRRAPWVRVLIYPARVQGEGGEAEIAHAIRRLSDPAAIGLPPIDTLIVARGGGSIEDLWNFNEEIVARAIADCPIPVVSGVGHEIDFTIADFVADHRAPTPSAAAELVVPDGAALARRLENAADDLENAIDRRLNRLASDLAMLARNLAAREPLRELRGLSQTLDYLSDQLDNSLLAAVNHARARLDRAGGQLQPRHLLERLSVEQQRIASLGDRLQTSTEHHLRDRRQRCRGLGQVLDALAPDRVFARGFSLTTDAEGNILRSTADLSVGDALISRLADGTVRSQIIDDATKQ